MVTHPLQKSLDYLPEYLSDATLLYRIADERIAALGDARRAAGNTTAAGSPGVEHKSLNRAVVVAAVGALEAFTEDLALRARDQIPGASVPKPWFAIQGLRGMVQTPNSESIAKLLWVYFQYDPRPDWHVALTSSWAEAGSGSRWRTSTQIYKGDDAAKALDSMVKARHGFAHQDTSSAPRSTPGIVEVTSTGKLSLQSHHAFNAMSFVVQIAVQMTHGLASRVPGQHAKLRWKVSMDRADWVTLLTGTPAAEAIKVHWSGHPF